MLFIKSNQLQAINELPPSVCSKSRNAFIDKPWSRFIDSFGTEPPHFPHLKELELHDLGFRNSGDLNIRLESSLSVLVIGYWRWAGYQDGMTESLIKAGCIKSLETLICDNVHINPNCDFEYWFLIANTQIKNLGCNGWIAPEALENDLLPLLCSSFEAPTSLSLDLDSFPISHSAIEIIYRMNGLQQLYLSCCKELGRPCRWFVDHNTTRIHLIRLSCLRKLAFFGDTYRLGQLSDIEEQYSLDKEDPDVTDSMTEEMARSCMTQQSKYHRRRMMAEVAKCAEALPKLEWVYFGQYPMSITKGRPK